MTFKIMAAYRKKIFRLTLLFLCFFLISPCVQANPEEKPKKLIASLPLPSDLEGLKKIRVLISKDSSFELESKPVIQVYGRKNNNYLDSFDQYHLKIRKHRGKIQINERLYEDNELVLRNAKDKFQFKKEAYEGEMLVYLKGEQLFLINNIDLESYVRGVVPTEMYFDWPLEALKAQAVLARTYAVYSILKNPNNYFHLSADIYSQVYKGAGRYRPTTDEAVFQTRGQILTHANEVLLTFFHSTSGGHTSPAHQVFFINEHPSLMGVASPYSKESPHDEWQVELTVAEIEKRLKSKGLLKGAFVRFQTTETDGLGRITRMSVVGTEGETETFANEIRLALGSEHIRSTFFSHRMLGDRVKFNGLGWGHGVGMCQWGAKKMAELDYHYSQILAYYYPQTQITQLEW